MLSNYEYWKHLNNSKEFQQTQVFSTKVIKEAGTRKEKYHNFLRSDFWKEKRAKRLRKGRCEICRSKSNLHLHHISYGNVFGRINTRQDIVVLCAFHHKEFHNLYGVATDMRQMWQEYKALKH